jgi:anaerobic selenocysteine-containing dehydrogenase
MAIEQLHTYCAMCVSNCGVLATVEDGIFTQVNTDPEHPNGCICVKGTAAPEIVYSPDRLQYPMKRTRPKGENDPGWVRISWEEAMTLAASRLLDIKAQYGAEAVVFSLGTPSGTGTNDYWKRHVSLACAFGSPNWIGTAQICLCNRLVC